MIRRSFLQVLASLVPSASLAACSHGANAAVRRPSTYARSGPSAPVRAICFDLFTLFDPRSVVDVAESVVGASAAEFCEQWRTKQFQYAFLRAAAGQYTDFRRVTEEALAFAAQSSGLELSPAARARLVRAYSELTPWPDTREALTRFRESGLRLAPLANYAPSMLGPLLANAQLGHLFETQISTDAARTYKPHPAAYALGPARLGLSREQIVFAAFGGWDAMGAKWFGYPTFWVNRLGVVPEAIGPAPDGTGPTLTELAAFVEILTQRAPA